MKSPLHQVWLRKTRENAMNSRSDTAAIVSDATALAGSVCKCRLCGAGLKHTLVDLGNSPLCESFLRRDELDQMEPYFPLHVQVCHVCYLAQLKEYVTPEHIFREYAYFSSYSTSWVAHAKAYCEMIAQRLSLGPQSLAVELASNDGYLLQHFPALDVPVLGIEPARNVAQVAIDKGIPTITEFFGVELAARLKSEGKSADLILGNNVLAQVPDLNDFVGGMKVLLKPNGTITLEFPHLQKLMDENQFDTIYHEHFSYFSALTIDEMARRHGLVFYDVEEIPTHGGSLRVYLAHAESGRQPSASVIALKAREERAGFRDMATYSEFAGQGPAHQTCAACIPDRRQGKRQDDRRLRCARQRQYAPQLLWHRYRFSRFHGRSQSLQARSLYAGYAYSNSPRRDDRRDEA